MNEPIRPWMGLAAFVILTFAAAGVGSWLTGTGVGAWYAGLRKPSWTPPNWVFGPVWSVLYLAMAVAAWLVWRDRGVAGAAGPLGLFVFQLALNVAWSGVFFGLHNPRAAFFEILVLWLAIAATTVVFWHAKPLAGWLFVPYLFWVAYAAALNFALWRMNA